jgi:hypothetical protein
MTPGRQGSQLPPAVHRQDGKRLLRRRWLSLIRQLEALRLQSGDGRAATAKERALILLVEEVERTMARMDARSRGSAKRTKIPSSQLLP